MVIAVPPGQLSAETLSALIEEFITRDGAVHGHQERPLGEMVRAVQRQLESGEAVIVFDDEAESCTIVPREMARGLEE